MTYRRRLEIRFPHAYPDTNVTFGDLFGIAELLDEAQEPRSEVQSTNPIANMVAAWAEPEFEAKPSDAERAWDEMATAEKALRNFDPTNVRVVVSDDKQTPGKTAYEAWVNLPETRRMIDERSIRGGDWKALAKYEREEWETIGNAVVDRHGVIADEYKTVTGIIAFRRSIEFVRNQDGHCQFRIKVQAPPGNPYENGAEKKFVQLDAIARMLGLELDDEPNVPTSTPENDAISSSDAQWKITLAQKDERIAAVERELSEMKIARDLWQNALVEVREAITGKDKPNLRDAINALDVLAWHVEEAPVIVDAIRKATEAIGEFRIMKGYVDQINATLKALNLPGPSVAQAVEQLVERVESMGWERERTLLILRTANKWFGLSEKETLEDAAEVLWSNLKSREHLRRAASALTQTTEPHAFGDALVKKLAKAHALAKMSAVVDGRDPAEEGALAIIAELAKTNVELPSEHEIAVAIDQNTRPSQQAKDAASFALGEIRDRVGPVLAAKDAEIARLAEWNRKHAQTIEALQEKVTELEKRLTPPVVDGKTPEEVWDEAFSACVRRAGLARVATWKSTSPETRAMSEAAAQAVLDTFGRQMVRKALERARETISGLERLSNDTEYGKQWAHVAELSAAIDAELAKLGQAKSEDAKTNVADHRPAQDVIHQIREKVQNLDKYKFDFYKQGERSVWDASFVKEEHVIEILDAELAALDSPTKSAESTAMNEDALSIVRKSLENVRGEFVMLCVELPGVVPVQLPDTPPNFARKPVYDALNECISAELERMRNQVT